MPPRAAAPRRSDHARRRHVLEATRRALAFVVLAACAGLGGAVGPVSLGHGMPIDVRMLEVMRFDPDFFSSARDPDVQLVRARIDGCAGDACGVWMCEPEALEEGWRLSGVRLTCEQAYGPPGEMEKAFMVKRGSCVARYGLVESASGEGGDVQGWAAGEATKEEEVPPAREAPNAGASSAPPSSEHSGTFQNILEGAGGAGTRGSLDKGGGAVGEGSDPAPP
ncbi:hypothetical protein T484DRAFT_1773510 [Baffinella frigidus]|nr:hypothetical protein T484DRAFT_1773510 [Cryptophyta sp. CCMP2293]